jgi:[protein-PII] uridylyltransferase
LIKRLGRAAVEDHAPPALRAASRRAAAFSIAPWVRFDNELAASATVIEVSGRDRPGVLAELARVLADARLQIGSAHIGAYGERVEDVFYVTEESGAKLSDPRRMAGLRARLVNVLKAGDPQAPSDPAKQPLAVAVASEAR